MGFVEDHFINFSLRVWKPGSNTPYTTLGETLVCGRRSLPKGPVVGGFFGLSIKFEPGSGPLKPMRYVSVSEVLD